MAKADANGILPFPPKGYIRLVIKCNPRLKGKVSIRELQRDKKLWKFDMCPAFYGFLESFAKERGLPGGAEGGFIAMMQEKFGRPVVGGVRAYLSTRSNRTLKGARRA